MLSANRDLPRFLRRVPMAAAWPGVPSMGAVPLPPAHEDSREDGTSILTSSPSSACSIANTPRAASRKTLKGLRPQACPCGSNRNISVPSNWKSLPGDLLLAGRGGAEVHPGSDSHGLHPPLHPSPAHGWIPGCAAKITLGNLSVLWRQWRVLLGG